MNTIECQKYRILHSGKIYKGGELAQNLIHILTANNMGKINVYLSLKKISCL